MQNSGFSKFLSLAIFIATYSTFMRVFFYLLRTIRMHILRICAYTWTFLNGIFEIVRGDYLRFYNVQLSLIKLPSKRYQLNDMKTIRSWTSLMVKYLQLLIFFAIRKNKEQMKNYYHKRMCYWLESLLLHFCGGNLFVSVVEIVVVKHDILT